MSSYGGDNKKQVPMLKGEGAVQGKEDESVKVSSLPGKDSSKSDASFSLFLSEVDAVHMPTGEMARPVRSFTKAGGMMHLGSGKEQVIRLISKVFTNPYEVLLLTPDSSEEDAKNMHRSISRLIHPDKCKERGAAHAFDVLQKAHTDLMESDTKTKYANVIGEA